MAEKPKKDSGNLAVWVGSIATAVATLVAIIATVKTFSHTDSSTEPTFSVPATTVISSTGHGEHTYSAVSAGTQLASFSIKLPYSCGALLTGESTSPDVNCRINSAEPEDVSYQNFEAGTAGQLMAMGSRGYDTITAIDSPPSYQACIDPDLTFANIADIKAIGDVFCLKEPEAMAALTLKSYNYTNSVPYVILQVIIWRYIPPSLAGQ